MKEIITKNSLNQSIELISELNLDEDDYEKIFEKFKLIIENTENKEVFEIFSRIPEINSENDLKTIMKKLSNKLSLNDLNILLQKIIRNEDFVDFIQDLFIDKLI